MNHIPETPDWGLFALVSYIPDPLGSFLHGLRQALPGEDNPRPHITILPPRPLKLPVEAASKQARKILRQFSAFEVELSRVCYFVGTSFLYLDVGEGSCLLHDLHDALNAGDLGHREELQYRPHLTLGGPVDAGQLEAFQRQAEGAWRAVSCARRFEVDNVVGLWLSPSSGQGEWHRLWSHHLQKGRDRVISLAAAAVTSRTY